MRCRTDGCAGLLDIQHFVGHMDHWDPMIVDGLAWDREVILFDNAGVSRSGGDVPTTIEGMAAHAIALIEALDLTRADLLGFSTGSLVAQQVAVDRPDLVRRLILIGSSACGGVGMASLTPEFQGFLAKPRASADELLLDVFFTPSPASQAAGRAFLEYLRLRTDDRDIEVNEKVAPAQIEALAAWGRPGPGVLDDLQAIDRPVLVVSGSDDVIFYTANAYTLQQHLPDAQLILYPDSNHAVHSRYPDLFLAHARLFLDARAAASRPAADLRPALLRAA